MMCLYRKLLKDVKMQSGCQEKKGVFTRKNEFFEKSYNKGEDLMLDRKGTKSG